MRVIPCDPGIERVFLGARPQVRDGVIVTNEDNDQIMVVSVLGMPTEEERAEVFEVKIPSRGIPKQLAAQTLVKFQQLTARHWAIDGRSGASFSASALVQARSGKAATE